jgi:hypothetical protein
MGAFLTAPKLPAWSVSAWANVTGWEMSGPLGPLRWYCITVLTVEGIGGAEIYTPH